MRAETESDLQRVEALLETMLLAASADGDVSDVEMDKVAEFVVDRPEFKGVELSAIEELLRVCIPRIESGGEVDALLAAIKERLPQHGDRSLAFGLAIAIAFADQHATREELGFLETFVKSFELGGDEVDVILAQVESGASLDDLAMPILRAFAETMVIVSAADGEIQPEESQEILGRLRADPAFAEADPSVAESLVQQSIGAMIRDGIEARARVVGAALEDPSDRRKAFELGVRVAEASDGISASEAQTLEVLRDALQLDPEIARDIISKARHAVEETRGD